MIQHEILAEAEELFFYHLDTMDTELEETASRRRLLGDGATDRRAEWRFDLKELVEAISFKFAKRRPAGQPLKRLLLTQADRHSEDEQVGVHRAVIDSRLTVRL